VTGVAGLRWAADGDNTVLTVGGARIVLVATAPAEWCRALEQAEHRARGRGRSARLLRAGEVVDPPEHAHRDRAAAYLGELVPQLSATLRRIMLLTDPAIGASTVELLIAEHLGRPYLFDATGGDVRVMPLWSSLAVPLDLWPAASPDRRPVPVDPGEAVIRAVSEVGDGAPWETWTPPSGCASWPACRRCP